MKSCLLTKALQATLVGGMIFGAASASEETPDPVDLSNGNLFTNPGFKGGTCFEGWTPSPNMNLESNLCASQVGALWFNHNGKADDPGVTQIVTLEKDKKYLLQWQWRAGDTARTYAGIEPQAYFGVKIGNEPLMTYSPNEDITSWKKESASFTAISDKMTLGFYGEINGLDGDVALNWVSLKRDMSGEIPPNQKAKLLAYSINAQGQTATTADDHYLLDVAGDAKIAKSASDEVSTFIVEQLGGGKVAFKTTIGGSDQYLTVTNQSDSAQHTFMVGFKPGKTLESEFYVSTALICNDSLTTDSVACSGEDLQQGSTQKFVSLESASANGDSGHYLRHANYNVGLLDTTAQSIELEKQDSVWRIDFID